MLQEYVIFQEQAVQTLTTLHQIWAPFSLEYTPHLLQPYMTLVCNLARLQFLISSVPHQLIIQLYTLIHGIVFQDNATNIGKQPFAPLSPCWAARATTSQWYTAEV